MISTGRITKVKFSLTGDDTTLRDSFIKITSPDVSRNNLPYPEGVFNAHLGTSDHSYKCQTCHNKKGNCFGHEGHIALKYPVWNPMGVNDGKKWLKLVCHNCGYPVIGEKLYRDFSHNKRLDEASKIARASNKICPHCSTVHPIITKDPKAKDEPLVIYGRISVDDKIIEGKIIYPHQCAAILDKITDETVREMGQNPLSHPRNCILRNIKVPPINIRMESKKKATGRRTNDELTTLIQVLVKKNDSMPSTIPEEINKDLAKQILELNNAYYDFVRAGGETASIGSRLKGKGGRFRRNQLGKRVRKMCRSTIVGNPRFQIDQVGFPIAFARRMQVKETVQEFNRDILLGYLFNGTDKYPGASLVIKKLSGKRYTPELGVEIDLEIGDELYRDLIDGDVINYNRQPSLKASNISTMRIVVINDPNIRTFVMNPISCVLFDADFDGDQMNALICSNITSRNEITEISALRNYSISHANGTPPIGQLDDSIIGSAELTRSGIVLDKYHAMLLFRGTTIMPSFENIDTISGRDCMSKIFASVPINFRRASTWYKQSMEAYINYDPTECTVVIDHGIITSGILDKDNIGKGAAGGIFHTIAIEYGTKKMLDCMYNMQQIACSFLMQHGCTIGINDFMISSEAKTNVDNIASDIINQSQLITDELYNGEIIPPIGKTIEQFYEERQINALKIFDDFTEPILRAINPDTNNLFKMIATGSKGKISDMFNMMSSIGQKLINGERILQKFGYKRSLAYFPRFDSSPESRGYITNSYVNGMRSAEYVFNAMAARFDMITRSLTTAVTGEQSRKSIKNLESKIVNNFRWVVNNRKIVQFAYGDDFLDPRRVSVVLFPTVSISDQAMADYRHEKYPDEFELMMADRVKYRRLFMQIEEMNVKEFMSDRRLMAVDVGRIISATLQEYVTTVSNPTIDLDRNIADVREFCNNLPYVHINRIQQALRTEIPEHIASATWLMQMLVRSHLHPRAIATIPNDVLQIIFDKIRTKYLLALIDPGSAVGVIAGQSFSAPLTQYMLDAQHRSASGGTSKTAMVKVKDILSAKEVEDVNNSSMHICVQPRFEAHRDLVQIIANNIEELKFKRFITSSQIFFEKYGEPTHYQTLHETSLFTDFAKYNPLLSPPSDLVRWCIRFVLNKTSMILKNMALETIIIKLRYNNPDLFIVHNMENSPMVVVRVYMRAGMFKTAVTLDQVKLILGELKLLLIRGITGVLNTTVVPLLRTRVAPDGSLHRAKDLFAISTVGSNLAGIFENKFIDKSRTFSDSEQEMNHLLGISSGQYTIISSMRSIIESCTYRHYTVYANEMTHTGRITAIEGSGIKTRENKNILLRMGYGAPIATLEEAAVNCTVDEISGVTAPLIIGTIPKLGTTYNTFVVNEEFVRKNVRQAEDIIGTLFED